MFKIDVTVDRDIFDAITETIANQPALMNRRFAQELTKLQAQILARLQVEPGPVQYPIRWTSERQRRAFFATNGFGRGIPTRRSGKLVNAWKTEFTATSDGGLFSVVNNVPYERYVTGVNQQGFHADTGWIRSQNVLADALVLAEDVLIDLWYEVTK